MFLSAIRLGDFVYGTTGDFGPAFLTALDVRTGEAAWQARGFARASLVQSGDRTIVLNEDGDLALARLTAAGAEILARAKIFDTVSWTVPTLVGTTLYARDREQIVALNLGRPGAPAVARGVGGGATGLVRPLEPAERLAAAGSAGSGEPVAPAVRAPRSAPPGAPAALGGSWQLDTATSTVADLAPFAGLAVKGAPRWIFVTQPENGTLVIEAAVNTGHARFYRPRGSTTTTIANGTIAMTSHWSGTTLVSEGRIEATSGAVIPVRETLALDGDALVVTIAAGEARSTLRFTRLTSVGSCTTWPTPCKKAGS